MVNGNQLVANSLGSITAMVLLMLGLAMIFIMDQYDPTKYHTHATNGHAIMALFLILIVMLAFNLMQLSK